MFANVPLAERVEATETKLVLRLAEAARAGGHRVVLVMPVGAGAVVHGGEGAPYNKMVGIGFGPLDEDALSRAEAEHDALGAALRAEVATLAEPVVFEGLSRRGYSLVGFENVLGLVPRPFDELPAAGVEVRRARPEEYDAWRRVVVDGFAAPDGSAPETESFPREALDAVFREFANVPELERYVAMSSGELVGGASLVSFGDVALMAGASTLPTFRRRGVQRALLHERLTQAARGGIDLCVVTTQPGSQSQSNAMRAGFALLYSRAVLVRAPRA